MLATEIRNIAMTGKVTFLHNGDYSGDVKMIVPRHLVDEPEDDQTVTITLPFQVLRDFILDAIRKTTIAGMENLDGDELWELMTS